MANLNPPVENLALGRGQRPKLGNETVAMRMSQHTREKLEQIAESYDCFYGGKPWIAGLLAKIGSEELAVVPSPKYPLTSPESSNLKQAFRDRMMEKGSGFSKA